MQLKTNRRLPPDRLHASPHQLKMTSPSPYVHTRTFDNSTCTPNHTLTMRLTRYRTCLMLSAGMVRRAIITATRTMFRLIHNHYQDNQPSAASSQTHAVNTRTMWCLTMASADLYGGALLGTSASHNPSHEDLEHFHSFPSHALAPSQPP